MTNHTLSILNECACTILTCHTFSKDSSPNLPYIGLKIAQKIWIRFIHMDGGLWEINSRPQGKKTDVAANIKNGGRFFGQLG